MLETERLVKKSYNEELENWVNTQIINIDDYGTKIADSILQKLNSETNYQFTRLENIWKEASQDDISQTVISGGITKLTQILYDMDSKFFDLYNGLCHEILKHFNGDMAVQRQPTIRVHCTSESNNYCPNWHSDLFNGHPCGTINVWIPFTQTDSKTYHGFNLCNQKDSKYFFKNICNSIPLYELVNHEEVRKSDFLMKNSKPVNVKFGEAIIFDSRCLHSGLPVINHTRVSIDMRIIEKKYLSEPYPIFQGLGSGKTRTKAVFDLNNFYKNL